MLRHGTALRWVALAAALAVAAPAAAASAPDELDKGPPVGAALPHALEAPDQSGETRSFRSLRGKKGLILQFSRSFDW